MEDEPRSKELAEIRDRYKDIYISAKHGVPLADKFHNSAEYKVYLNLVDAFRLFREKAVTKEGLDLIAQNNKKIHYQDYRDYVFRTTLTVQEQERFIKCGQLLSALHKEAEILSDRELIESFAVLLGVAFSPVEEKVFRESLARRKESKPKRKKQEAVRHKYGEYKNVLLSDEEMSKLKAEFPKDWATRIEKLSLYVKSTGKGYKDYLATIRNWARRDEEKAQVAAERGRKKKESVYSSEASYDLLEFEKNIVGLKYLDEEGA